MPLHPCRPLHKRHIPRRTLATLLLAGLTASAVAQPAATPPKPATPASAPSSGQPATPALPPIAPPVPSQPNPSLPPLVTPALPADPAASMAAYTVVREWVSAVKAPDAAPADLVVTPAACITLRLAGEVVGRGTSTAGDHTTVWVAAKDAIAEAIRRLPVSDDALADQRRRELAAQITVAIEIAGPLVPLREATYDDVDDAVSPGRYGLAAKAGDKTAATFPSSMLATGALPGQGLATIVGQVLGDPAKGLRLDPNAQPSKVTARDGVTLYKFALSSISQPGPGDPGLFLFRGARVIPIGDVTHSNLRSMGRGIADHLRRRIHPTPTFTAPAKAEPFLGLRGTYYPLRGAHEPNVAPPAEQAMVAYALTSWTAYEGASTSTRDALSALLNGLFSTSASTSLAPDIRAASLGLAAVHAARAGQLNAPADADLAACLSTARTSKELSMAGLMVLGMSTAPTDKAIASRIADAIYAPDAKGQIPDITPHVPWLILAERNLGDGAIRKEAVPAMRAFRQKAYIYVMTAVDAGEENPDMVGGVAFPGVKPPLPTAQSLRVISALAMLLADPNVTPKEEFDRELVRFMPCLRYARQLCADEWTEAVSRDPEATRWGVRAAIWDPRMPGEASALGLITIKETLAALDRPRK